MSTARMKTKLHVRDYLTGEETSPVRREFLHGEIYVMPEVSQNHNRITGNLLNLLSSHLVGTPCEVYSENIKVNPSPEIFYTRT